MDELPKPLYEHLDVQQFKKLSSINKYVSKPFLAEVFRDALPNNGTTNRDRLTSLLSNETVKSNYSLQYLNFVKMLIKEAQSDGLVEGLLYKLKNATFVSQIQSLPKNLVIKSKEKTDDVSLKGYVSTLMAVKTKPDQMDIELSYTSKDDLLYDIYVAGQCLSFFAIYLPTIFESKFLSSDVPVDYSTIINEFKLFKILDEPATIFTTEAFKSFYETNLILSKKAFLSKAVRDLPEFIDLELNHPFNLPRIIHNLTWEQRNSRLKSLQDIYNVFYFLENNVQTEVRNFIMGERDSIVAVTDYNQKLQEQLQRVKLDLLNPHLSDEELVFNINGLQKLGAFSPRLAQGFEGLLRKPFKELEMIKHRKPIDLKNVKTHPAIYLDFKTLDKKYQFLSPMNIDFSFEYKDQMRFMSPAHLSLFYVLTRLFGVSERLAHRLMMKSKYVSKTYKEYQQECDKVARIIIHNRLGQSVEKNILSPSFPIEDIFEDTKQTTLIYTDPDNTFLGVNSKTIETSQGNFLGRYVQFLRDGSVGPTITQESILRWFDTKLSDMTSAIKLYNIDTQYPMKVREFLSTVFRFPTSPVSCKIKNRYPTLENKIAFDYLCQFLGTILTDISITDFETEVTRGRDSLSDFVNEEKFKKNIPIMVEGMAWFTTGQDFPNTLSKLMTMILKKNIQVSTVDEAWEIFGKKATKRGLDQNLNRFNFFRERLLRSADIRRTLMAVDSPEYNPLSPL